MSEALASAGRGHAEPRAVGFVRRFIWLWAVGFGGMLLLAIVFMTAWSATSGFLFDRPIAGDFELVQFGIAIAAFSFLPLCQLARANVIVDSFTLWAGPRLRMAMELLGALVAIAFSIILLWRMSIGMHDYYVHEEYTAIIGIPLWWAFPPMLFSLFLLLIAALISTAETLGLLPRPEPAETPPDQE
ncbi:MAG TPA: TRAP transporter small permease [Burkholderiales bacterium]